MRMGKRKLHEYIIKKLQSLNFSGICSINNIYPNTLNKLSTNILKNTIKTNFYNGAAMDGVVCMFDNLFSFNFNKKKKNGLYKLSSNLTKWIKKYSKLNSDSTSGYIYVTDIFTDIEVIIKIPKYNRDDNNIIREYFIGISEINKLRYIIPTFVYTFGAFLCPANNGVICKSGSDTRPFVIFEKIPGNNMEEMLKTNSLTFTEFLGMFLQVLLGLEVAQRNISFCHYDFHSANLMCRTIDKIYKYSVALDNNLYNISASKYLPVIIDFGLSSVKSDDMIVGSYDFKKHGMLNYMLPGVDMYKFLVYCIAYSEGDMYRQISSLLLFYGDDDPYKILVKKSAIEDATHEYIKKGSYSKVTTRTPLEFIEWILVQPEYTHIASLYMKKMDRDVFIPISFSTVSYEYEKLFNKSTNVTENVIKLINNCSDGIEDSYVISMYFLYVLERFIYSIKLNDDSVFSKNVNGLLSKIKNSLNRDTIRKLINIDLNMLFEYKNLNMPDMKNINDYSNRLLNITIESLTKKNNNGILKLVSNYFDSINFFKEILVYLQFVYTIKELNMHKEYKNFLIEFYGSVQYNTYKKNYMLINKTSRWCESLIETQLNKNV